jgi:hypothetical protein
MQGKRDRKFRGHEETFMVKESEQEGQQQEMTVVQTMKAIYIARRILDFILSEMVSHQKILEED